MIKIGFIQNHPNAGVWDHKGKTEIAQIFILYGDDGISFLQFQYVENGNLVLPEPSPSTINIGRKFNTVKLNYPNEFLTSISGSYSNAIGFKVTSITFGTNRGSYGPFGQQGDNDKEFNFQMGQDKQFGGFHGSNYNGFLESIGVYVKPITTLSNHAGKVIKKRF